MNSEAKEKHKAIKCDIGSTAESISDVRKCLILVHDFGECNTTSAAYEQDNLLVLKLFEKFKAAREEAHVFLQKDRTTETMFETGIRIFVMLYCRKDSDSLTYLRYLKYIKIASSLRTIKPESLPSTSRVKRPNGKYPGSKRLGLEVRGWLFGASYNGCQEPAPDQDATVE